MRCEQLRMLTGNVGGSFGMKASVYPEYPCVLPRPGCSGGR